MTIPSTPRRAGPFTGNGVTTSFPFSFKVFAPTDIKVVVANSSGVETVLTLNSDYTVTLNANQDTSPGGTVNYPISGSPLPPGSVLSIIGNISYDQLLDLPSGGNFSPLALENQLDRITMQIQQLREEMDRTAKLPPTSSESVEELVDDLQRIADSADNLDTVANNTTNINTVAGSIGNVNTVVNNVANVNAVAANATNINTVANNITNVNTVATNVANVNTVAADVANVNTVATNVANVNTVAANVANVNTVAGAIGNVNTVANNITDVTNYSDTYLGAKASPPTTRNDGSALRAGDLYFDTTSGALAVYHGSGWTQLNATATWGPSRTITIGNTGKSVDGSADVSWSLAEIGAAAATATVNLTGDQTIGGIKTFSSRVVSSAAVSEAYLSQDDNEAPFFATVSHSGSSYCPVIKIRGTGAANTSTFSLGLLHNTDNTQDGVLHFIQAADVNSRAWRFSQTGDFVSPGNVTAFSDIRLKTDLQPIPEALAKVKALTGYTYTRIDTGERQTGLVAQDVQRVLPEAVIEGEHLSLAYGNLVGLLVEAIKEQALQIEALTARVEKLEGS